MKYEETRPWGKFEQFTHNEKSTVKIITVNPNSKLSLQYHEKRDEFWKILEGEGKIILNDKTLEAKQGDEFHIQKLTKHRAITENNKLVILEISTGEFQENDIIRIEDEYSRK
ncbi:phosphomannose isomerase type II C-terminal cupin domain [Candidatus Woesearchaeota archaeon]|nr:phosphomannose isomerase type II C-terminal cupin domain [Candidatus Woesearchaeota archaeon]